jgi:hypothetical protein
LTLADFRPEVQRELSKSGIQKPTLNQVANAFYTLYPCPFSAVVKPLRVASQNDVEGVWLNPETAQKYRFSPQSPAWQQFRALPINCEGVGFYPNGEMRVARLVGTQVTCQFRQASELDAARKNPIVSSWNMLRDGRLNVSRTDVPNHVEEWDIFVATGDFEARGLLVKQDDLIAYLRKERGNDLNVSTMFWHLQKLPK